MKKLVNSVLKALLLTLCLCSGATSVYAVDKAKTLIFAIDGLAYESFLQAKGLGLFPSFIHAGRHIAPYPSMTEPAWTEVLGSRAIFPIQGNAKTVEAAYFDREKNQIIDDPRNVFARYASSYNFYRAFDYYFNPYLEGLMYFPQQGVNGMELEQVLKDAEEHLKDNHYIAYISSVDAVAHTQKGGLYPLLKQVSATVEKVLALHKEKGVKVRAFLLSDHGNEGAFAEGKEEQYLEPVDMVPVAGFAGLRITEKLENDDEIAIPILALANVANVYFKDLAKRRVFANAALSLPSVSLITFLEQEGDSFRIVALDQEGEAHITWGAEGYLYKPLKGNPLHLPATHHNRPLGDQEAFLATAKTAYPDSLFRLVQSATKQVENAPDLILNFKKGYMVKGNFLEFVNMLRTHGSLDAGSSLGLLASNGAKVPAFVRSQDVLSAIGIGAKELFHHAEDHFHVSPEQALAKAQASKQKGIATRVTELSQDLIFRRIQKIIGLTMDFLNPREVADLKAVLAPAATQSKDTSKLDQASAILKKLDPKQAMQNVDSFLALKDVANGTKDSDEILRRLKQSLARVPGLEPLHELYALEGPSTKEDKTKLAQNADALRRLVMKLYAAPYLLDEALNIPEFDSVPDPRDLGFAQKWFGKERAQLRNHPNDPVFDPRLTQELFLNIFQERRLLQELSPASFPLLYNAHPQDITVVYVPGIYNELFDTEIFARGLRALQENLGLRVLYADVDGRCASELNAKKILERLKADTKNRTERGYKKPRYLILGYSKGGVDSTEMLLLDPKFARAQIAGLVAIASPLQGTTIVESADLPGELLDQVLIKPTPAECKGESGAKSLLRAKRSAFWSKNIPTLAEITRFYSVSFQVSVAHAHPWMKITKNIARFQSPNDGVVTVESSKFPEELGAVDLGSFRADHLAGILASRFPQGPFLEALMLTLFELDALSPRTQQRWFAKLGQSSAALMPDYHKRALNQKLLQNGGTEISRAMGPFPSLHALANSEEIQDWYGILAKERALLQSPLRCANDSLQKLRGALVDTMYELKPVQLRCQNGKPTLVVESYSSPAYKFWESSAYEEHEIKTLEDLVHALLAKALKSGRNLIDSENKPKIPPSKRAPTVFPESSLAWSSDTVLDIRNLGKILGDARIQPAIPEKHPELRMLFDHQSMKDFRKEYGFFYEATAPGNMDDNPNGYFPVLDKIEAQEAPTLRLRSANNSIRMTSAALRFKPADYPKIALDLKVTKGPKGADPAKGGSGKDDSAFQIWFNLRSLRNGEDRTKLSPDAAIKIFGYYWDEDNDNPHPAGKLFENYYSNKNFVIATLPEAWQVSLEGGAQAKNKWFRFQRNLLDDIRRAFPRDNPEDFEVVGITIQTDSNDTKSSSEAYFREMRLFR